MISGYLYLIFSSKGRAMQLYKAGYKTLVSIAKANPEEMVDKIKNLPRRACAQIISTAKVWILCYQTINVLNEVMNNHFISVTDDRESRKFA